MYQPWEEAAVMGIAVPSHFDYVVAPLTKAGLQVTIYACSPGIGGADTMIGNNVTTAFDRAT